MNSPCNCEPKEGQSMDRDSSDTVCISIEVDDDGDYEKMTKARERDYKTGISFSGGGIRSAALASGVLRRVLQKKLRVDCLSCVSGGGYVGSAYMDWKIRNGGTDNPAWHEQFFNTMRKNSGVLCHWRNPLVGIVDVLVLFILLFLVGVLAPLLLWIPVAFPMAYFTDYLFGDLMRTGFTCPGHIHYDNETFNVLFTSYRRLLEISRMEQCVFNVNAITELGELYLLFTITVLFFLVFFTLSTACFESWRPRFTVFAYLSLIILSLTFLPWFMEQFIPLTSTWVNIVLLMLCVLLWLGVPQFRSRAAWGLLIFFYATVAKWRVYRSPVWIFPYIRFYFPFVLWVSGILFWFGPYLVMLQQGAIHAFYRWKLQRAFYTKDSAGRFGCRGISLADFWPMCSCDDTCDDDALLGNNIAPDRPLTLSDLKGTSPEFICSVLVDNWQYNCEDRQHRHDTDYALLTLSPYAIERIDDKHDNDFKDLIGPRDIKLSDAMATSAAVVTYHMGKYKEETLLSLQVILGMTMGKSWISDRSLLPKGDCPKVWLPFVIQCTLVIPLLVSPLWLVVPQLPEAISDLFLAVFIAILLLVIIVAVLPTGSKRHGTERFVRWCIVNVRQVRFLREILQINNIGSAPPAVLHLSDGGHVENLGLLPLLKKRLAKIIVVDGGYAADDHSYADELRQSIDMARTKLRCSFRGLNNRDVVEDIREQLVERSAGNKLRHYKFYVDYYDRDDETKPSELVGTGEILYLLPRHPHEGIESVVNDWEEYFMDTGVRLKASRWGTGPVLTSYDVDKLTFACCELCHCPCWKYCSQPVCGRFPQHVTVNQFFTSQQFSAYHREGYRAAMEAGIEAFVKGD